MANLSNINNKFLVTTGGDVGIGVTSPSSKLSISGSQAAIDITRGIAGDSKWEFSSDSTGLYFSEMSTGTRAYMMTIKETTGNVGIGTTSPDYTLHLLKSSGDTEMYINGQNGQSSLRMGLDARNWQIKTAAAPYLWSLNYVGTDFQTPNIITATVGGNVGIGTDSPTNRLEVKGLFAAPLTTGSAQNGIARFSQTLGNGSLDIGFGDPYSWIQSRSSASYATNYNLALQPNGGNVGIGTTTPVLKLEVQGTASTPTPFGSAAVNGVVRIASGGTNPILDIGSNINAPYEMWLQAHVPANTYGTPISLQPLGGNVGIGTTGPATQLHVESDNPIITLQRNNNGNASGALQFRGNDNVVDWQIGTNQVVGLGLEFNFQNSNKVYIETGGNVGIGVTNPASKLHISGAATDNEGLLKVENTYASGGIYFPSASFINSRGDHSYGVVSEFRINTAGDSDRPSILFYGEQAASSWQIGQVTNGWGTNDAFGIGYRASNDPTTFNSWPTNYFTILTNGNVGIGTTSPYTKFEVVGGANISSSATGASSTTLRIGSYSASAQTYYGAKLVAYHNYTASTATDLAFEVGTIEAMRIQNDASIRFTSSIQFSNGVVRLIDNQLQSGFNSNAEDNDFWINYTGYQGGTTRYRDFRIGNGKQGQIAFFDGSTGNVGIGVTAPTYKLHVANSNNVSIFEDTSGANGASFLVFNVPGAFAIGSIGRNGTTNSVSFNTGSDYRLKEDLQDFNALDLVNNITAYDYKWKNTEQRDYGFIAHELQEVIPNVVTGEKDGEKMQSVDYSKLTPILLKAIQELEARVKELENK